jgi:hypothetical protein
MIGQRRFRSWLAETRFFKWALAEPADLSMFREKPSAQFILGMGIVGFSYLMAWPFITVLGVVSFYLSWPALFLVGSPLAYGLSHLVFLAGMAIAGKDSIKYMNAFNRWLLYRIASRLVPPEE